MNLLGGGGGGTLQLRAGRAAGETIFVWLVFFLSTVSRLLHNEVEGISNFCYST